MNPNAPPTSGNQTGGNNTSGGRIFAVLAGVFVGLPVLLLVGLFTYHAVAETWISWRFSSHELNRKIVEVSLGWSPSYARRDISSLFPSDFSRDRLLQQLESIGYRCKVQTSNGSSESGFLSCETLASYDTFCRRDVFVNAEFGANGRIISILANALENC